MLQPSTIHLQAAEEKQNGFLFQIKLPQVKLLSSLLVIQLVWYILKQLFTSASVKVVDIYLAESRPIKYPPLFISTSVNNC